VNATEILRQMSNDLPNGVAIIDAYRGTPRTTTFSELDTASQRVAGFFHHHGIGPGDAMLVFCPMSRELYVVLMALVRLGAVAVFLDPSAGKDHIERCCSMYPPKASISPPKAHLLRLLSPALRKIPCKFSTTIPLPGAIPLKRANKAAPFSTIEPVSEETPALITFTSGSTGEPKMVARSHGFLLAQHTVLQQTMGMQSGEIDLSTLPIVVLSNLASGATSLIPNVDLRRPGDIDPEALYEQIVRHGPSSATGAPSFLETLADFCIQKGYELPGITKIFCGGAPVFPPLLRKLHKIAPAANIIAVYGSTEAEPIADLCYSDISAEDMDKMTKGRGLLAGPPVDCIQLRIINDQWGTPLGPFSADDLTNTTLPPEAPGEIVVSGDHVLKEYMNGAGDRQTKFTVEGTTWHRTGDSGYLDDAGRLWLLGRCEAVHSDDRGDLYPFAVESAAQLLPGIRRSALVSEGGKRTLVVEPVANVQRIVCAAVKDELSWAQIDSVKICARIPVDKRHNSKIDYGALRQILDTLGAEV